MNNEQRRAVWETYVSAWKERTREGKRRAVEESVLDACKYRDPLLEADGREALVDLMMQFQDQIPGAWFETTHFLTHHGRSVARWNMHDANDAVIGDGISYAEYDASGKLCTMTGFFETPASP